MVFVLDKRKQPLMPCTEKRARLLLARGRAVIHRLHPFTIRLKDRLLSDSALQPVILKIDPGSQVTGIAVIREEQTSKGQVHHALWLAELKHRGAAVTHRMRLRASYRRRRRSKNLRYRAPRFANRRRTAGWLAPSLRSRIGNLLSWAQRTRHMTPIVRIDLELVRFDTQQLQNPEITGIEYQQGELLGYEIRAYLLEKWGHKCAYCRRQNIPLQIDHVVPKSRFGSDRLSNLTLACEACNNSKGDRTAAGFGFPEVQAQAKIALRDAAAVNTTRWAVLHGLRDMGYEVGCWSGGRTSWNRTRFGLSKTHVLDALCVGNLQGVDRSNLPILVVEATGRGQHSRTRTDAAGFPRGYCLRKKQVHGFQTGDLVRAHVPRGKYAGIHIGRVVVRAKGSFQVGTVDGIGWRHCYLLQRGDGYTYSQRKAEKLLATNLT